MAAFKAWSWSFSSPTSLPFRMLRLIPFPPIPSFGPSSKTVPFLTAVALSPFSFAGTKRRSQNSTVTASLRPKAPAASYGWRMAWSCSERRREERGSHS